MANMTNKENISKTGGENPFSPSMSGYGRVSDGTLISAYIEGSSDHLQHVTSHKYFKKLVLDKNFACVAGQSAVRSENYVFCSYLDMTDHQVAEGVCHDISKYLSEFKIDKPFNTFVACFRKPMILSQMEGVVALYKLFLNMHDHNKKHFAWANDASSDVESPNFGLSIAGESFFTPFLYPYSGSQSRKSDLNIVVFNPHKAFTALRSNGSFEKLKQIIRARQSWVHPNLGDHGDAQEFIQYALVDPDQVSQIEEKKIRTKILGTCPFNGKGGSI